jgi:dihydrofolate reductase
MTKTILSITMSLDGFVAGRNITPQVPMGENGELLHNWLFGGITDAEKKILADLTDSTGCVIVGGATYNYAIEYGWNGKTPFSVHALVLTTREPVKRVPGFTFLNDNVQNALTIARQAAGDKNVWILGGGNLVQQLIRENLLDEIHIHIAPLLLGQGTRLFPDDNPNLIQLESYDTLITKGAAHLFYKVIK